MIKIKLATNGLLDRTCDAYAFPVEHGFDFETLRSTAGDLYPHYADAAKVRGFTGAAGSSLILTGVRGKKAVYLIFVGLGHFGKRESTIEHYRRAMGLLVRIAESHRLKSFTFNLPDPIVLGISYTRLAQESTTILHKASYHFDQYITSADRKYQWDIDVQIGVDKKFEIETQKGINQGISIAEAINTARLWCDMPPSALTPPIFATQAQKLAKDYGLKATVFDRKAIVKMGMGGIEGVGRGSQHEPRLVILEYKAAKAGAPTVAFVGKGITFDSGGLSIKPSTAMETMKDDMAGAAIVLSAMKVIAQFKPNVNVVALAPLAENMPSGTAHKPGDICRFYNGKTAEIKDTDAEGRLVLADALSYAVATYKPDAIIDVATLTGSCAAALGPFYAGLLSQHEGFAAMVSKASELSGDRVWRLPMDDDYKVAIKSSVADMANIGTMAIKAGVITAAFFLQNFVGKTPWVHLDVAGTAFGVPDVTYLRPGATGFGIRLLVDLVMNWNNADLGETEKSKAKGPARAEAEESTVEAKPAAKAMVSKPKAAIKAVVHRPKAAPKVKAVVLKVETKKAGAKAVTKPAAKKGPAKPASKPVAKKPVTKKATKPVAKAKAVATKTAPKGKVKAAAKKVQKKK